METFPKELLSTYNIHNNVQDDITTISLDYIIFSIFSNSSSAAIDLTPLRNHLSLTSCSWNCNIHDEGSGTIFSSEYVIQYQSKEYKISLIEKEKPFRPYQLKVYDPDIQVLIFLNSHLEKMPHYHIRRIKFTFDLRRLHASKTHGRREPKQDDKMLLETANQKNGGFFPYNYLFHLKKIKLIRSVDFIIISFKKDYIFSSLLSNIKNQFVCTKHYKTKSSDIDAYLNIFDNKLYILIHIFFRKYNHHWIRIEDPDIPLLQYLSSFLSSAEYTIAQLECTFDFYGPCIHRLYDAFKSSYVLLHSGKSKKFDPNYKDTEYSNDLRKTKSKGLRLYKKKDLQGNIKSARLELLYKRNKLKKMNVNLIQDVIDVNCDIVMKPLKFNKFNHDKFIKNFVRRLEKGIPACQGNINEIMLNIHRLNKEKNVYTAGKYAKQFISYSCYETHPFEIELKTSLSGIKFMNGGVTEIDSYLLFEEDY